ncbi:MAG: phosphoribosylanthranilate isomerase, partial [Muribaculaceae bacterium]
MLIKVCGMREPENIRAVEALGIDMMGFIFWQGSKRYVSALPAYMPQNRVKRVGVFVDAPVNEVVQMAAEAHLWGVQLHGSESAGYCRALREQADMKDVSIIKAICISEDSPLPYVSAYDDVCTMLLFDT